MSIGHRSTGTALPAVILAICLMLPLSCTLVPKDTVESGPITPEERLTLADAAYQARQYSQARSHYMILTERNEMDRFTHEALFRLSLMEIILPGEGPHSDHAITYLERLLDASPAPNLAMPAEALLTLVRLYKQRSEALRILQAHAQSLETRLALQMKETSHQKAAVHQWQRNLSRANSRVEAMEEQLDAIRQEIQLLKEIDIMLEQDE